MPRRGGALQLTARGRSSGGNEGLDVYTKPFGRRVACVCIYSPRPPPPRREKMQRALSLRGMNASLLARVASIIAEEEDAGGNASTIAKELRRDQAPS